MVREFGEYDPRQQRVSKQWKPEATKYCETKTKRGATCLDKEMLAPSCVAYCLEPGPCTAWAESLVKSMERVARVTMKDEGISILRGSARIRFPRPELTFDGERWTVSDFEEDDLGDLLVSLRSAAVPMVSTKTEKPEEKREDKDQDEDQDEDENENEEDEDEENDEETWETDAVGAAAIICYASRIAKKRRLSLFFSADMRSTDTLPACGNLVAPVEFRDANGGLVHVTHGEQEWQLNLWSGTLHTTVELQDTHALWCQEVTQNGHGCYTKGKRLHRGCADYCVRDTAACTGWTYTLLKHLTGAMADRVLVSVPRYLRGPGDAKKITIQPKRLDVDVLDKNDGKLVHMEYQDAKWSVAVSVADTKARMEKYERKYGWLARTPTSELGQIVIAQWEAERLLCDAMREVAARKLRVEIAYQLPLGDEVRERRHPVPRGHLQLKRGWKITPGSLWLNIRIR